MNDAVLGIDPGETGIRFAVSVSGKTEPLILPGPAPRDLHVSTERREQPKPLPPLPQSWNNSLAESSRVSYWHGLCRAAETAVAFAAASRNLVCPTAVVSTGCEWSDQMRQWLSEALHPVGIRQVRFLPDCLCLGCSVAESGRWLTYISGNCSFSAGVVTVEGSRLEVHKTACDKQPCLYSLQTDLMEAALARILPLQQAATAAEAARLQLRAAGETAMLRLLRAEPLTVTFENDGEELSITLDREFLQEVMDSAVNRGMRQAGELLDATGNRNLSGILVHGSGAEIARPDKKLEQRFGVSIRRGNAWDLACGAAFHGEGISESSASGTASVLEQHLASSLSVDGSVVQQKPETLRVRLPSKPTADAAGESKERVPTSSENRDGGHSPAPAPNKSPKSVEQALAMQAIHRARNLIEQGEYQAAVAMSHQARRDDSSSPQVLSAMIDVHIEAANANRTRETYKASIEWLMCAVNHDRGNRKTRQAIADRHLLHSQQMLQAGHPREALAAAEKAFQLRPNSDEMEAALDSAQEAVDRLADST